MFEQLIAQYGYPALLLGSFLEGEVTVIAGGYLAAGGYLKIEWVMLIAFIGTLISDQLWFWLGRRNGRAMLARRPRWQKRADKALGLLRHYPDLWVLCFRFLYGLRTVMPIAIGLSGYSWRRYLVLNVVAAALWAAVMSLAAFYLGRALQNILGTVERYQLYFFAGLLTLLGIGWLFLRWRRSRQSNSRPGDL